MAQNQFTTNIVFEALTAQTLKAQIFFEFVDQAYKFFFSQKVFGSNFFWAEA